MSVIGRRSARLQHFYKSGPMPCPYLPDRIERKLFTRLTADDPVGLNTTLSQAGFRRSHDIVYRPVCPGCDACVPVRIPVNRFTPTRTMRRTARRNASVMATAIPPLATQEQYALFARYQSGRHAQSDMAKMTPVDFAAMIEEGNSGATVFEFRDPTEGLVGVMLADRLHDGLSAVYSFYSEDTASRSLGTYMILCLIDLVRAAGCQHLYLGYWIRDSLKMAYKAKFRPLEALTLNGWQEMGDAE